MENKPKLPITIGLGQGEKRTWISPTVELIGRNTIESGPTSYPLEGRHVIGGSSSSTIFGDGIGS